VFFSEHSVDCVDIARRSSARGRQTMVRWQKTRLHTHTAVARLPALARLSCFMIPTSDRQTDGRAIAYSVLPHVIMANK